MKPAKEPHVPVQPADADIRKCAYLLWKEEGSPSGRDLGFWFAARERLQHLAHEHPHPPERTARLAR